MICAWHFRLSARIRVSHRSCTGKQLQSSVGHPVTQTSGRTPPAACASPHRGGYAMTFPQSSMVTPAPGTALSPASGPTPRQQRARRIVAIVLTVSGVLGFAYAGLSVFIATQLIYQHPKALDTKPANLNLDYRDVAFPSRDDHLTLKGWFIPGRLPNGQPTVQRTLIMVHGAHANRADQLGAGLLDLAAALVHHGFAVLTFDMRGHGESDPAPFSLGYFEQRDV